MARTYAETLAAISQMLQDTGNATYDTTELGYWIEEGLKDRDFNKAFPHIVPVVFKVESRTGTDTAGTASSLTDNSKNQFVSGDATNEKVVHNTTDDTWAVILANSSTSVNTLSGDIMDSGESYEIYNKRCRSKRQIYIGDVTDYLWIDSVEYPIGTPRNWIVFNDVLEILVDLVGDSDSTLPTLGKVDVLVSFVKPHRLLQATDSVGLSNGAATEGATSWAVDALGDTTLYERGDEFHVENHRYRYTITADVTTSANAATIAFFPGLERTVTADVESLTFVTSTLLPDHEEIFAQLVAARAVVSDSLNYINDIPKGGQNTWANYQTWAAGRLVDVLSKMASPKRRTKRTYPRS